MKESYGASLVFSASEASVYWKNLKSLLNEGEKWLYKWLDSECDSIDRHKYSALLFIVLLKKPLFKSVSNNSLEKSIGYYSSEIYFAWKSALYLLGRYIVSDKNLPGGYIEYIEKNGVSVPSENYMTETLRSLQMSFRPFKKKNKTTVPPPFDSMLPDPLYNDKTWGFVFLFANVFSLVENYSLVKFERDLLYMNFKK